MSALDDYFAKVDEFTAFAMEKVTECSETVKKQRKELQQQQATIDELEGNLEKTNVKLASSVSATRAILSAAEKVKSAISLRPLRNELLFYVKEIQKIETGKPKKTARIDDYLDFLNSTEEPTGSEELWIEITAADLRRIYSNYFGGIGQIFLKLRDPKETKLPTFNKEIYEQFNKSVPISVLNRDGVAVKNYTNQFDAVFQPDVDDTAFGTKMLAFNLKELELPYKTAVALAYGPSGSGKTFSMDKLYKFVEEYDKSSTNKITNVRAFQFYNDVIRPKEGLNDQAPQPFAFKFKINQTQDGRENFQVAYPFANGIDPSKRDVSYNSVVYQEKEYPAYNGYHLDFARKWESAILPGLKLKWDDSVYYWNEKKLVSKKIASGIYGPVEGDNYFERFKQTRIYDTFHLSTLLASLDTSKYNPVLLTRYADPKKDGISVYNDQRPLSLQIMPYMNKQIQLPLYISTSKTPTFTATASASERNLSNYALFDHSEFKFPNFFPEFENIISKSFVHSVDEVKWYPYHGGLAQVIQNINRARFTRKMAANPESSRSQLVVEIMFANNSKLIMMDLAGNESVKGSSIESQVAYFEASYINKTLDAVKENTLEMIKSLGEVKEPEPNEDPFMKYLSSVRKTKPVMTFLVCAYGYYKTDDKDHTVSASIQNAIVGTMDFVQDIFPKSARPEQPLQAKAPVASPVAAPAQSTKKTQANGKKPGGGKYYAITKKNKRKYYARTRCKTSKRRTTKYNKNARTNPSITKRLD